MSLTEPYSQKKIVSVPTVISTFIGVMAAVPMALAIHTTISAEAAQPAGQAVVQANGDDFAKYAHAYTQGYEASAASTTSVGGHETSCAGVSVSAGATHDDAVATTQVNAYEPMARAHGGYGSGSEYTHRDSGDRAQARLAESMANSYNSYVSMVNNSSSVTHNTTTNNTNSNNTVGSHNSTRTDVNVEDAIGVVVGVDNNIETTQTNITDSFNSDSYNTSTETTIVNDSFNDETTTNTDISIDRETNINTEIGSNNTDNSTVDNSVNTNTDVDVDVDANVDVNSHNDTTVVDAVLVPEPEIL